MSKYGAWAFNVSLCADTSEETIYSNVPNQNSFLFNSSRHVTIADLSGINSVRMVVNKQSVPANEGCKLTLKYSETFSLDPNDYIDIGVEPVEVGLDVENTFLTTNWTQIIAPQNDVFIAIISSGGDGNTSPHFGHISINFA